VMETLKKTGTLDEIGHDNIVPVQPGLGQALDSAWQEAQTWLEEKSKDQKRG
jgi:hypothetical protein